ncbi:MAG: hypothetical protein CFE29_06960 [Bradyrhizobiaceae bacterium PARB1]|jgi:hypothetical protein|nr:MAG: hypothetical protein CFE29_06960 [Bradyrhizobiaceae bacterium PARB1]
MLEQGLEEFGGALVSKFGSSSRLSFRIVVTASASRRWLFCKAPSDPHAAATNRSANQTQGIDITSINRDVELG